MKALEGMAQLTSLSVEDAQITDSGLEVLNKLPHIEDLSVFRCYNISDDCFQSIAALSNLRQLAMRDTPIFGAGLAQLKASAHSLKKLDLAETQANDEAMLHVASLQNIEWLDLWHTRVTDAGLQRLAALDNLKHLNLTDTRVTDAGLEFLGLMSSLETLNLAQTKITDAGLDRLKGLGNLKTLILNQTKVTRAGAARLREAMPHCNVRRD